MNLRLQKQENGSFTRREHLKAVFILDDSVSAVSSSIFYVIMGTLLN